MRISGGTLAGRKVAVPPGIIRPSMDRMRESVFAALGDLGGLSFLDLFSGSGVIALEAASRGASPVEAVEADRKKAKTLLSNTAISPIAIQCHFISSELYVKRSKKKFNIIFCDPPFPYKYKSQLVLSIGASLMYHIDENPGNFAETSTLLIHRPRSEQLDLSSETIRLSITETRHYGNSSVDFIKSYRQTKKILD
ncbi:MAG: RsmD family RNA methyltransferase [Treponema sp.]|jgi:16S rRNA (guanine(966)-N(2))-methyltransferase RsmD|nr:RsmD family RNA methyltransferase [Treponema sp.]